MLYLQQEVLNNFSCICCRLLTFFQIKFSKFSFRNTIRASNGLDPGQDKHSVGPDLGPNYLQVISRQQKLPLASKEFRSDFQ